MGGVLRACCADEKNLGEPQKTQSEDLTVRVCAVCGRRHFELAADPGVVGALGGRLG